MPTNLHERVLNVSSPSHRRLPPAVVGFCVARLPLMVHRSALRRNATVPNWERRALNAMIDAVLQSSTEDPEGAF